MVKVVRFYTKGSVRLRFGDGTVRAVPVFGSRGSSKEGVFLCFSTISHRGRFRFRFRFLETVPAVPVPRSVPAKTVPTVPVSGSGSVPGPLIIPKNLPESRNLEGVNREVQTVN